MNASSEPVPQARTSFVHRLVGVATLHVAAFEEIEHDRGATLQAGIVVALASLASSFGLGHLTLGEVVADLVTRLFQWFTWSVLTWWIGTRIFEGTADLGEMLRTLGFVHAPGLLYVLLVIPVLEYFIGVAITVWILVAGVLAIRQGLDVTTARALGIALAGGVVYVLLYLLRVILL